MRHSGAVFPSPVCDGHGGGPAALLRDRCAAASCYSGACPPPPEATPGGDSRTGGARPPARAGVAAEHTVIRPRRPIPDHLAAHADKAARPTLAQPVMVTSIRDGLPLGAGRHHFFDVRSFSTALSSIASARSFFSFEFSSSSARSHRVPTRPVRRTWLYTCRRSPS
jgi:hypothetical protein